MVEYIAEILQRHGAEITKTDLWGVKRLAYEINKQREGYYVLHELQMKPDGAAVEVLGGVQVFVPVTGDVEAERERILKELGKQESYLTGVESRLRNAAFVAKAPPEVIEKNKVKRAEIIERIDKLRKHLDSLG